MSQRHPQQSNALFMANQDAVADSFKRQTASSGTSDDGLGSIECERVGISLGKNRQHVDRPQGQFANQEDLRNGILALSSSLAGIATACGKPSNGGGAETTPLSAETGEIVATVTRTLSEGLKKISGQTTGEKVWTPEAQGALQALRSQLCRELESLVCYPRFVELLANVHAPRVLTYLWLPRAPRR